MIVVNPATRQFNIPGADLVFGVTADAGSAVKYFQCPRFVGNNVDIASSFVRINYRNANGEIDFHLVNDVTVEGDNVTFGWELHPNVTMYKGQIAFVMCVTGPDAKVKWHTTLGRGQVLEGLEPEFEVEAATADGVAALIAMVEAQTVAVENTGADQVAVVKAAAKNAQDGAVAEIEAKRVNTLGSIPADYTALSEAVNTLARNRAGAIVCEAAGSTVVVNDASTMAIQDLRIFGRSVQDGIPSPDAPVDIVSVENPVVMVCGKNLIPPTTGTISAQGITSAPVDNGTVLLNGTATQEISRVVSQNFLLPAGKYTLSVTGINKIDGNKDRVYLNAADGSGTIVNYVMVDKPVTFEMETSMIVRSAIVFAPNSTYNNQVACIQLEAGDTANAYEPHKATQTVETIRPLHGIPVDAGGNYIDENGQQWICDEVDLERGMFVQRINRGSAVLDQVRVLPDNGMSYCAVHFTDKQLTSSVNFMCDRARVIKYSSGTVRPGDIYENTGNFVFVDEPNATLEGMKAKFDGAIIQYILKIPIETPLSEVEIAAYRALHSKYPNTTVLNTAGAHMAMNYVADTKLYIDKKIKEALT